jgi:hypothetical protein
VPYPREVAALGGPQNPVIARLLARNPWPAPNRPVALFAPTPNLFVTAPAKNDVNSLIAKIDHSLSEPILFSFSTVKHIRSDEPIFTD